MPDIFIRYDDVEYGLRTGSDIIAMSGICLWHEPFEYRFSSSSQYYEIRNEMIVNALHWPNFGFKQAREVLRYSVKVNIGRYRYSDCKLAFIRLTANRNGGIRQNDAIKNAFDGIK